MTSASAPALRAGDELLRRYFDLGLIGMAVTSPTKGIIEVNDEICRILGYERQELLKMTWAEMTHPDDLASDVANFKKVMAGEFNGYALDKRWIRKDGTVIQSSISVKCVRDADGAVDFFVALLQDVTERKRMEETLRSRELFIQRIADLTPATLSVFDVVTQRDTYTSSYVMDLLGYTRDEIAQMDDPFATLWHPDDIPIAAAHIAGSRKASDGQVSEIEYRVRRRDGEWRWLASRSMPFSRDGAGNVRQIVSSTSDITEQKQATDALRRAHDQLEQKVVGRTAQLTIADTLLGQAHQQLELILNSVTDNVFSLSKSWRFTYLNRHARAQMRKLGKNPETLIGAVLWDEFSEVPNAETLHRVMSERIAVTDELFYEPLGEWVENHVYPTAEGGLLLFQRYITKRKRMELELQRSEANLAEAQRLCHIGSGVWNVQTDTVWWSQEMHRLYGFEPGRVVPTTDLFFSIVHPEDRPRLERDFERVLREQTDYTLDFRIVRPDGATRYIHSVGRPLVDESGNFTEVMGTVIDVTDRRHAEDERARLLRSLITAQEEERRRISLEMHDQFGQQLSVLMLKIGALKAACNGHVELCAQIESLEDIARHLDAGVDFLVRNIRPTALDDLGLPVALSNFVASWKAHFGVNAELHISGMERGRLNSETETVLYRVLQEALTNIAKHAGAMNVGILLERHSDHVSLIVEDDGAGFDVDHQGSGPEVRLGVVGMRERTAIVDGSLDIESRPGHGTTLVVRIPTFPPAGV
jgi:PAS domain S-box-containing protein